MKLYFKSGMNLSSPLTDAELKKEKREVGRASLRHLLYLFLIIFFIPIAVDEITQAEGSTFSLLEEFGHPFVAGILSEIYMITWFVNAFYLLNLSFSHGSNYRRLDPEKYSELVLWAQHDSNFKSYIDKVKLLDVKRELVDGEYELWEDYISNQYPKSIRNQWHANSVKQLIN